MSTIKGLSVSGIMAATALNTWCLTNTTGQLGKKWSDSQAVFENFKYKNKRLTGNANLNNT